MALRHGRSICVAGVALGDIHLDFGMAGVALAHINPLFCVAGVAIILCVAGVWQHPPSFCVAGVALMALGWAGSGGGAA